VIDKNFIKQSNFLLRNKKINFLIKSIHFLHFLKFHPEYIYNYKKFFFFNFIFIKKIFFRFYNFIKYNFLNIINFSDKTIPKSSVLIISHCITKSDLINKNSQDRYFGNLKKILKKNKFSFFYILLNHTNYRSDQLNKINKRSHSIVMDDYLNFILEIKVFFYKIYCLFLIILNNKIFWYFKKKLLFSLFDNQTAFSIKIYFAIRYYLRFTNSKFLVFTFEGFSWERLLIFSARNFNKSIKCIGYQHSLITNNNYSIFNSIPGGFDPDYIWTTTPWAFKKLKKNKKINIFHTGSLLSKKILTKNKNKKNVLVIPEGIYSECYKLFNFSIQCANKHPKLIFFWQLHPVINVKKILDYYKSKNIFFPKNIKVLYKAKKVKNYYFVLYRGSSAIVDHIRSGSIPMYFKGGENLIIDPIGLPRRNYVNNLDDFSHIVYDCYKKKNNFKISLSKIKNKIYSNFNKKILLETFK
jgi:hypothetical protein